MTSFRTRAVALLPLLLGLALAPAVQAEVIRQNVPAQSLSAERIAQLPDAASRQAWAAYLDRSHAQSLLDRATLAAELPAGATVAATADRPAAAQYCRSTRTPPGTPRPRPAPLADTIVSFQTPAGGWSKNQDRTCRRACPASATPTTPRRWS